jgi:hypothetical protein
VQEQMTVLVTAGAIPTAARHLPLGVRARRFWDERPWRHFAAFVRAARR